MSPVAPAATQGHPPPPTALHRGHPCLLLACVQEPGALCSVTSPEASRCVQNTPTHFCVWHPRRWGCPGLPAPWPHNVWHIPHARDQSPGLSPPPAVGPQALGESSQKGGDPEADPNCCGYTREVRGRGTRSPRGATRSTSQVARSPPSMRAQQLHDSSQSHRHRCPGFHGKPTGLQSPSLS